jgi:hypothetical protein
MKRCEVSAFQKVIGMADRRIDPAKLRVVLQGLSDQQVRYIFEEMIDVLPQAKLVKFLKPFVDPAQLRPDSTAKGRLLADVRAFEKASLAGEYYEAFRVDSRNYREKSGGTRAWIAECERLLDRCTAAVGRTDPMEVCQGFDILFALLDRIDEGDDNIVFFADEGGSWQVGVNWEKVLPAWFTCFAATVGPEEYARRVVEMIEEHGSYRRDKYLAGARRSATPAQRKALRGVS